MKTRGFVLTVSAILTIVISIATIVVIAKYESEDINSFYEKVKKHNSDNSSEEINADKKEVYIYDDEESTYRELVKGDYATYVFVGDSRYRGMQFLAEEEDVFICENGRGYDFLIEQMSYIVSECDGNTALIIGLGVNDNTYNVDKYLNTLSEMADTMDCQIYYMLVNPVDEEKEAYNGYHVKNENIEIFNERMRNELDERIGVIDTNTYLKESGFETMDGLHYTNDTYEKIYNFIKSEITE